MLSGIGSDRLTAREATVLKSLSEQFRITGHHNRLMLASTDAVYRILFTLGYL